MTLPTIERHIMNPFFTGIFYKLTVLGSGLFIIAIFVLLLIKKTRDAFWPIIGVVLSFAAFLPTLYQQWNYLGGTRIPYSLSSKITAPVRGECFNGGGTLTIGNQVSTDVVQCHHTDTTTLYYSFALPVDVGGALRIVGLEGTFGIDQENANLPNATATWQVFYNGDVICSVTVHWHHPGHCVNVPNTVVVQDKLLIIKQEANSGAGDTRQSLFAGIISPVLILKDYR
jgi:hypothetical protein